MTIVAVLLIVLATIVVTSYAIVFCVARAMERSASWWRK
jgi:hypothetical protein